MAKGRKLLDPIPPGEILYEEFMKPMGISINRLARDVAVPPGRISEIVNGKRAITATPHSGLASTSVYHQSSGSISSPITTYALLNAPSGQR